MFYQSMMEISTRLYHPPNDPYYIKGAYQNLCAPDVFVLKDLIRFAINLIRSGDDIYDRIQVYSPRTTTQVPAAMIEVGMKRSEQFLLYKRGNLDAKRMNSVHIDYYSL
jgi:hypothetical protein